MAPVDPHSYTDGAHPVTAHAALAFYLDFDASAIHASALLTLSAPHSGDLLLDTRALAVHSASTATSPATPIPFALSTSTDPVLGTALTLTLPPNTTSFLLTFSTSPAASALQWLAPPQTASGLPFVFSQCQSIHARSIFPCHDTPAARVTYSLLLNVPARLSAVAAARHVARRDPVPSDHRGACDEALWCAPGRIVEEFEMAQCVPPYLFAFAAGAIGSRDLGPRTRVYAEGGDTLLDDAAREFAGVEDMVKVGESLFGPYEWERFDLLVLPPSFPYGGMENPRMVFLTPTVIKGDAAGAQVVAHELAHSWTGNLITNKTNEDFWLNEGFTTYAERRIVEVVQGEERAALNMGIGWRGLNRMMDRFKDNMEFTKLKPKMAGIDPDDVYSEVPYEKGFQFLWRIERQIGRPAFDEFLKKYIATFKFQSIDTETFLEFLKANVPGIESQIDLDLWIEGTGIPPDAMEPDSATYRNICTLAAEFKSGKIPSEDEVADWGGQEWELYLENLSTDVEASQDGAGGTRTLTGKDPDQDPFDVVKRFVFNPLTRQLSHLPDFVSDPVANVRCAPHMGILTQTDRGHGPPDRFVVADLQGHRMLRFLSETEEWEMVAVALPPRVLSYLPTRCQLPVRRRMEMNQETLAFGGRLLWVDVTLGAFSVDPFSSQPELRFLELPSVLPPRERDDSRCLLSDAEANVLWTRAPVRFRRVGVSQGRLRYVEVSQDEPFLLSSFAFDEEAGCGWRLEHQVALHKLLADDGGYLSRHLQTRGSARIVAIDPLDANVVHLEVAGQVVFVDMDREDVTGSCVYRGNANCIPCVLPPWLGSSRIPSSAGNKGVEKNKTLADILVRSDNH